ncbi:unnamed protein product [Discosporangium mesarthrocarpum]
MGTCTMNVINSEMAYLGYLGSEAYGLTWKVRGFCKDKSNVKLFDSKNVYGDMTGSKIHHNFFGMYSYGLQGGDLSNNEMYDNEWYGFDPHDDSDNLTITNNDVHGNGKHGIIASKRCDGVTITGNTVSDGGSEAAGIMLHRSSNNFVVKDNTISNMQDAGIAIFESFDGTISNNVIKNVKYGIRLSMGSADVTVSSNSFDSCSDYGFFTYQGTDPPEVNDGRPSAITFSDNTISATSVGFKFKNSDGLIIKDNEFTGTKTMELESAKTLTMTGNTIPSGVDFEYSSGSCFKATDISNAPMC